MVVLTSVAVVLLGVLIVAGVWLWTRRGKQLSVIGRRKDDDLRLDDKQLVVNHSIELGSGAFANVYMATLLRRKAKFLRMRAGKLLKKIVAAKVCKDTDDSDCDDAMREVELMRALGRHQHIVQLIGYTQAADGDVTIILEYCEKGNLLSYLRKEVRQQMENASKPGTVPGLLRQLATIGAHISDGMVYLSSKNYVHRDLAARNILLTSDMTAKISDFGLCRYADEQLYRAQHARKLPVKWMAPESLRSIEFSTKSDVWSFGILMWEVFSCGDVPFDDVANADILETLDAGERPTCPRICPPDFYQFLRRCWSSVCQERPSFEEANSVLSSFANDLRH